MIQHVLRHFITTTRTGKFKPTATPDEYKLKVYVGGGQSEKVATERALKEIEKFLPTQGYTYYTIVSSRYEFLPMTGYVFTVKFRRA
jgi:hypothetical protein